MEMMMMNTKLAIGFAAGLLMTITVVRAQAPQQQAAPAPQVTPDAQQAVSQLPPGTQSEFLLSEFSRIQRGFAIAPVPLSLRGRDLALVGLGSYLINAAGGCNDCHTNPSYAAGGNPFQGQPTRINAAHYLAGGMAFGPFISRNLTPDANGLPAGLTYAQFSQEMRTGVDLKQVHPQLPLLQVMPWPLYQNLLDRDLRAMYEYLLAIPHAEPGSGT
jgi:hypothetical protein